MCDVPQEVREALGKCIVAAGLYFRDYPDDNAVEIATGWLESLPNKPRPNWDAVQEWIEEALYLLQQPHLVVTNEERRETAIVDGYGLID